MKDVGKFKRKYRAQMEELKEAKATRAKIEAELSARHAAEMEAERRQHRETIVQIGREAAEQKLIAASNSLDLSETIHQATEAVRQLREENAALAAENGALAALHADLSAQLAASRPAIAAAEAARDDALQAVESLRMILANHETRLRRKDEAKVEAVINRLVLSGALPAANRG